MDPSLLGRPMPAPTAQRQTGLMTKRTFLVLLAFAAAIIIGVLLLVSSGDNSGTLQQRLSARQATTVKLVDDGQKNLSSDDLTKFNSELSIVLKGDTTALDAALKGVGMKKVNKEITAAEADEETFTRLKTAKLNAQYDTTYKNVMTHKLESLQALLRELHGATNSKSLKTTLNTEYGHVTSYLDELQKLN